MPSDSNDNSHDDFHDLMRRLAEGDEDAAGVLLRRYGVHVLQAVRRYLGRNLRRKFDSGDFVQAIWASFFDDRTKLQQFNEAPQLIAYLAGMAHHKVLEKLRDYQTQKRDISLERSLHLLNEADEPRAATPTASQVAMSHECWEQLLQNQPVHYQRIMYLKMCGHKQEEIAALVGVSQRTVRRVLNMLPRS